MEKSKLLNDILAKAEKIKEDLGNDFVTTEDIFSSFLSFYSSQFIENDEFSGEYDEEEKNKVFSVIFDTFNHSLYFEYEEALRLLNPDEFSKIVVNDVMVTSELIAQKNGLEVLDATTVLEYILSVPTDMILDVIILPDEKTTKGVTDKAVGADKTRRLMDDVESLLFSDPDYNEDVSLEDKSTNDCPREIISRIAETAKEYQKILSSKILGQDNAINTFVSGYFQSQMRAALGEVSKQPTATFLFAGPPGVGKTYLSKTAAELMGRPFKCFDMSEYCFDESIFELCGTDKVYKGTHEGALTKHVRENPDSVLLFDEIEKAHITIIHLFLQILENGKLGDLYTGKEVDFSRTIIFFTTNAARKLYEDSETANLSGISKKAIIKALETDVDPLSGKSAFPASICSRLAMGNVVMFNHMEAHVLRAIAEKELKKLTQRFEESTQTRYTISDDVYSCILFAEGGNADARTIVSKAKSFFNTELYELLRLVSEENSGYSFNDIENINIDVEIPDDEVIRTLFKPEAKGRALCFGNKTAFVNVNRAIKKYGYNNTITSSVDEAIDIAKKQDIDVIFCDLHTGQLDAVADELNVEDVESDGRTFFRYVCESTDIPIYIVCDEKNKYNEAEEFSLSKEGSRGTIDLSNKGELPDAVAEVLDRLHQQRSMYALAKANKLISYETAQTITDDGKTAKITIFDLELKTCVAAEDMGSILSNISRPETKFEHIIGNEEAKNELQFFVEYLKDPKKLSARGIAVPKGVLFYGPPGTGKTMLAKAVAGEANITFISTEGNKFIKKYMGEGENAVHSLFATARKYAPTIIFIDEIDAIAKERKGGDGSQSVESVLTAFLSEMDGFKTNAKKPVFVLAATNFDVEPGTPKSLDGALLRRFDRHIYIDLPDKQARLDFINKKITEAPIFRLSAEEIESIAVRSTGMSLAVLDSIFEFSLRIAIRTDKDFVDDEIFEEAFETYVYGKEKKWKEEELQKTAYHEAGHAFLCWHSGEKPSYLTIVARGNHGGYMRFDNDERRGSYTKNMLLSRIRTALGGRAAELVFFGDDAGMTTGAAGDLRTATVIAKSIICNYGMDESVGLAVFDETDFSDSASAQQIRDAVNKILTEEMNSAKQILKANEKAIKSIVDVLLKKNHLSSAEIDKIFCENAKSINK